MTPCALLPAVLGANARTCAHLPLDASDSAEPEDSKTAAAASECGNRRWKATFQGYPGGSPERPCAMNGAY